MCPRGMAARLNAARRTWNAKAGAERTKGERR
jgi:hypothetical protein